MSFWSFYQKSTILLPCRCLDKIRTQEPQIWGAKPRSFGSVGGGASEENLPADFLLMTDIDGTLCGDDDALRELNRYALLAF